MWAKPFTLSLPFLHHQSNDVDFWVEAGSTSAAHIDLGSAAVHVKHDSSAKALAAGFIVANPSPSKQPMIMELHFSNPRAWRASSTVYYRLRLSQLSPSHK